MGVLGATFAEKLPLAQAGPPSAPRPKLVAAVAHTIGKKFDKGLHYRMLQAENALQSFISSGGDLYDYEEDSGLAPREVNLPVIPEATRGAPKLTTQHQALMAAINTNNSAGYSFQTKNTSLQTLNCFEERTPSYMKSIHKSSRKSSIEYAEILNHGST